MTIQKMNFLFCRDSFQVEFKGGINL